MFVKKIFDGLNWGNHVKMILFQFDVDNHKGSATPPRTAGIVSSTGKQNKK